MANTMHVVTLSPEEQLTVKLVAQNYIKLITKMYMADLIQSNSEWDVPEKWNRFCRLFDGYEEMTHHMPTPYDMQHARTKLFNFTSRGMRQLLKMFETYNPAHTGNMEIEAIQIIESNIEQLKDKLTESSRHQYTEEEIRKALK